MNEFEALSAWGVCNKGDRKDVKRAVVQWTSDLAWSAIDCSLSNGI